MQRQAALIKIIRRCDSHISNVEEELKGEGGVPQEITADVVTMTRRPRQGPRYRRRKVFVP
jgi:hypothetical protein